MTVYTLINICLFIAVGGTVVVAYEYEKERKPRRNH